MIDAQKSRARWIVLAATIIAIIAYAFSFQIIPPLMTQIVNEFRVSNAEAGLLMSAVLIPGIILSIPVSIFLDKYGVRTTGSIALLFIVSSSILTLTATTFSALLFARLILGIGGAIIVIVVPTVIPQWFPSNELGKAMGLFTIGMPIATVFAFPVAGTMAVTYGWRSTHYVCLAIGVLALVSYSLIIKNGPRYIRIGGFTGLSSFRILEVWKIGVVWLFFNCALLSFNTWAPTLLSTYKGLSTVDASFYTSLFSWLGIPAVPIFGILSDRLGKRKIFVVAGILLVFFVEVAAAFSSGFLLIAVIIALGIVSAMVPGNIQTLPSEILEPEKVGTGFAILGICMNLGNAVSQPLIGVVIDATNSYTLSILSIAIFAALGFISSLFIKSK